MYVFLRKTIRYYLWIASDLNEFLSNCRRDHCRQYCVSKLKVLVSNPLKSYITEISMTVGAKVLQ
jgi:hypothetical protein